MTRQLEDLYQCDPCRVQWRQAATETTVRACWFCQSITSGHRVISKSTPKPPSLFRRVA